MLATVRVRCQMMAPIMGVWRALLILVAASTVIATVALGQTPQPFPRPGTPPPAASGARDASPRHPCRNSSGSGC